MYFTTGPSWGSQKKNTFNWQTVIFGLLAASTVNCIMLCYIIHFLQLCIYAGCLSCHVCVFFLVQNENKCKEKEKFHQVNSDGIKSYRNAGYASWDPPWWRQCDSIYPHVSYYTPPWIRVWASHEWRNENLFSGNYLPTNVIPEIFEWSTIFGKCILPRWFCFSIGGLMCVRVT